MNPEDLKFKNFPNYFKFGNIEEVIKVAFDAFFYIGAPLATIAIIYSGIMFITAGGDTAKAGQAKKNLTWAVTGLIIIFLAESIVVWVPQALNNQLQ